MSTNKQKEPGRCKKCKRDGHTAMLWHYKHGFYCCMCLREMHNIVHDFTFNTANADAAVAAGKKPIETAYLKRTYREVPF